MADVEVTSTSTNTVDVVGLNDIKAGLKLELVQPFKTEGLNTYDIKPLKTESANTYDVKPLKTDVGTTSHLTIDPLTTNSNLAVDLKPAVVDLCLTLNVGKVPSVCIRQPYRHKIAFSLYGMEVWGFSFSGEQETIVEELGPRPQVALGGAAAATAWPPAKPALHAKAEPEAASGSGLRIRLGP